MNEIDVLCVGHASYDLVFSVSRHPEEDEKIFAKGFVGCGGGPAANAAITVSRLGFKSGFAGYLGQDVFGEMHIRELTADSVISDFVVRGESPTPVSVVLVKPQGKRALINYKGETRPLPSNAIDFSRASSKVLLFDGHEPYLSQSLINNVAEKNIATVLDAGSVSEGTLALMEQVDFLVCSEKFARHFSENESIALEYLSNTSACVVITLGERGLIWRRNQETGRLPAYNVIALDSTGAGDTFHGAFAAGVSAGMEWNEVLRFASAAGALCCTKIGARIGIPTLEEVNALVNNRLD